MACRMLIQNEQLEQLNSPGTLSVLMPKIHAKLFRRDHPQWGR